MRSCPLISRALLLGSCCVIRLALVTWVVGSCCLNAQDAGTANTREPEALSIFPLGARQGTTVKAEILGKSLEGAYAVWSNLEGLSGQVQAVESADLVEFKKGAQAEATRVTKGHRAQLVLQVPNVPVGIVLLRVLTPAGTSNALPFLVQNESFVDEISSPHERSSQAQKINIPTVVNGKIGKPGEVDFYEIEAGEKQELVFEMISKPAGTPGFVSGGFSTAIALFEPSGSWFDAHQVARIAYSDESVPGVTPTHTMLRYRFLRRGRYLVQAASFSNKGGPEFSYQLRIASGNQVSLLDRVREARARDAILHWQERAFDRRLDLDRLERLWGRSLQTKTEPPERQPEAFSETTPAIPSEAVGRRPGRTGEKSQLSLALLREEEPNDLPESGKWLPFPALIEGTIGQPGDVDSFKFKVEKGQALAFEIETPAGAPPLFNPKLAILDETGREFLSNVFRRIARNFTFYAKTVQPKTVFTFELGGEYTLQIRDITSRVGDASCQYRVLIRPQIPHIGEIEISADRLNLVKGGSKKLNVTTGQEEGYADEVAISVEGLPEGVTALPGTEVKPDRGINPDEGPKERFLAKTETATILLTVGGNAPVTERPRLITIVARPVVKGVLGLPLRSTDVPLMVVQERAAGN